MERIAVLGSTGSIGRQTLEVLERHPDRFRVTGLSAGSNTDLLHRQIRAWKPAFAYIARADMRASLEESARQLGCRMLDSERELEEALQGENVDTVVAAVSGFPGLRTVWAALQGKKKIALANKESLVTAGHLIMTQARQNGVAILPVDSEHSAVFQCLEHSRRDVEKLILTASGGPFVDWPAQRLSGVTLEQALKHPNWSMGQKITIDSASLANKGLEVLEASHLFDVPLESIDVVVHRESIIHSMVQFVDGSVLAQLGLPDMKLPIQYALSAPYSLPNDSKRLDLAALGQLHFETPRTADFPALKLAYLTGDRKQSGGLCYNTGDEVGVALFREARIAFTDIPRFIERAMERFMGHRIESIDHVFELDQRIRKDLWQWYERNWS